MPSTPFGEHLKREREMRGVSLDEIAAATKINTRFLEALENGRWEELPGGAFNRGFVRTTSRFLGLDEDGMVAEFALETTAEAQSKPGLETSGAMPRDFRPAMAAGVILLLAVIAGGWFTYHEIRVRRQRRAEAAAEVAASPAPTAVPSASTAAPSAPPDAAPAASDAVTAPPNPPADASAPNATLPAVGATAVPPSPPVANVSPGSPAAPEVAATAPVKPEKLEMKITASKMVDVRVSGDGKSLFKGKIRAGASKHFEARDGFEVISGDSDAVQIALNGQTVSLDGKPGKRGSASFSRKDLKPAAEAAH